MTSVHEVGLIVKGFHESGEGKHETAACCDAWATRRLMSQDWELHLFCA